MYIRVNHLRKNSMHDLHVDQDDASRVKHGLYVVLYFPEEKREEIGKIVFSHDFEIEHDVGIELRRIATPADVQKIARLQQEEKDAYIYFSKKILELELLMQPVAVYFSFDEKCADFLYTAPDRVDFRELVKDLNRKYGKKLFLEQIGARDKSAVVGGCGTCGRKLCCSTFLKDRPPVNMNAIRGQELHYKDRDKLTGLCGKLKCCLNYELDVYEQLAKSFPPLHSEVQVISKNLIGTVINRSILDQQVRVRCAEGHPIVVPLTDVRLVRKNNVQGPVSELEHTLTSS